MKHKDFQDIIANLELSLQLLESIEPHSKIITEAISYLQAGIELLEKSRFKISVTQ